MLHERIGDVSIAEEKTCFIEALPAQLQMEALKKDDDGCLTLEVLKNHLQTFCLLTPSQSMVIKSMH